MAEYEFGTLVKSIAGHDKSKLYMVQKTEHEYVYLTDGKYRPLEHPKKKKCKHVESMEITFDAMLEPYNRNKVIRNEDIKRAIKLYQARGEV